MKVNKVNFFTRKPTEFRGFCSITFRIDPLRSQRPSCISSQFAVKSNSKSINIFALGGMIWTSAMLNVLYGGSSSFARSLHPNTMVAKTPRRLRSRQIATGGKPNGVRVRCSHCFANGLNQVHLPLFADVQNICLIIHPSTILHAL